MNCCIKRTCIEPEVLARDRVIETEIRLRVKLSRDLDLLHVYFISYLQYIWLLTKDEAAGTTDRNYYVCFFIFTVFCNRKLLSFPNRKIIH